MTLSRYPEDIRLHIDANSKTFTFEQTPDEREPLSSLTARLESYLPKASPYVEPFRASSARERLFAKRHR